MRAITLHRAHKILQRVEAIYLGLKRISHHLIEATRISIQHHDRHRDTLLSQDDTLVSKGHREIAHAQALQELRHLDISRAVAMGLNHRHKAVIHRQMTAEITDIMRHRIEINLQHRSMTTTLQAMTHALEMRTAITLQQYRTARNILVRDSSHKLLRRAVITCLAGKYPNVRLYVLANTDKLLHPSVRHKLCHARVELLIAHTALQNIRDNNRSLTAQRHATQRIQSQRERVNIGIIRVVYNSRALNALLNLQTHSHIARRELGQVITQYPTQSLNLLRINAQSLVTRWKLLRLNRCSVDHLAVARQKIQRRGYIAIRAMIYKCLCIASKCHLLAHLLRNTLEITLVCIAYRGHQHHIGAYHTLQTCHLTHLGDTRLNQSHLLVTLNHQ